MTAEYITKSVAETEEIAEELAKKLDTGGILRAFIALRGEMGVGKTAFVRGFARHFGITGVKSPTYTVVNEYCGSRCIYHFDMYRLEDEDDLWSIGFEDYVKRDGYVISEWTEKIESVVPGDALSVTIARVPECEEHRRITITFPEI